MGVTLEVSDITGSMIGELIAQGEVRRIRAADGTEAVLVPIEVWDRLASKVEDWLDEQDPELAAEVARARAEEPLDYNQVRESLGLAE